MTQNIKYWFLFLPNGELILNDNYTIYKGVNPTTETPNHIFQLPEIDNIECVATEINQIPQNMISINLRASYDKIDWKFYYLAGKASELIYFNNQYQFCPKCGHKMEFSSDISKKCVECGNEIWPPISPAIICLISKGKDEILMTHGINFKGNFHGLVSGFLETGESLEECLEREVLEETGIKVKNIKYFKSQPWPYPSGLMVGFFAEYNGGEIKMQESELSDCRWFNRYNMPETPRKLSMARMLIDYWLENPEKF
ncbi:MAG: NAD(+) diphosphatase [Bacteroidales bacterium]|nr:NAD(+) diphosphatase [Bacteroidales bacterium]